MAMLSIIACRFLGPMVYMSSLLIVQSSQECGCGPHKPGDRTLAEHSSLPYRPPASQSLPVLRQTVIYGQGLTNSYTQKQAHNVSLK